MKSYPLILLMATLLTSCEAEEIPVGFDEKIVVEGSIEAGKGAVVWLSRSLGVPYGEVDYEAEEIGKIPIRLAKVTVAHEGRKEVLVSRADPDHMLGWCYRGTEITGETGGEYTLTVEYSGYTLTATTTIPPPARLGEITLERDGGSYMVNVSVGNTSPEGRYMLMAKTAEGGVYNPCLFGIVDGESFLDGSSIMAFRPMSMGIKGGRYSPAWNPDEHVLLRLASIDRAAFEYWSGFMNDVINAHNPVYPSSSNLPSNIEGGGLGVWYGFSASYGGVELPGQ